MSAKKLQENNNSPMQKLLEADEVFTKLQKEGDIVKGKVIASSKKEVLLDISGMMTGIVRGKELFNE